MSISKKHLRKIIKEEMKRVKILKARNLPITTSRKFKRLISQNLCEAADIKNPSFRKELKGFSGDIKNTLLGKGATSCTLYLKESNGQMKQVEFKSLLKERKKGNIGDQQFNDIVNSSFDHDIRMLRHYGKLYESLSEHMISEGLITENGNATKKGKLLREQERNTHLTVKEMNDLGNGLLVELFGFGGMNAKDMERELAKMDADPEYLEDKAEEDPKPKDPYEGLSPGEVKELDAFKAEHDGKTPDEIALEKYKEDHDGLSPEEVKATESGGMGAIKKGLGGIWAALTSPFKAWKWFQDKVWGLIKGAVEKIWAGITAFGEKFDIKWVKDFVAWVEKIVDAVKAFCDKNKWLRILCKMVMGICIAYAVKWVITTVASCIGMAMSSLLVGFATGSCGAEAAIAAVSENKQQLNEVAGSICAAGTKAAAATGNGVLNLIKGAVKMMVAEGDAEGSVGQAALAFIDNWSAKMVELKKLHMMTDTDIIASLLASAKACGSDGAMLVVRAIKWVAQVADGGGEAFLHLSTALKTLGRAAGEAQNYEALEKLGNMINWPKEKLADAAVTLGKAMGWGSIPDYAQSTLEAAGKILSPFKQWMKDAGGLEKIAKDAGFATVQEFVIVVKKFKDSEGVEGVMAWKEAGMPALPGAALEESFNRMHKLAGVLT